MVVHLKIIDLLSLAMTEDDSLFRLHHATSYLSIDRQHCRELGISRQW